ncbi:MAG: N-acetylmuramoyl-L-alanine amidase family protein [Candidatus Caldatribacteriota bacterium]|nr:N-acetylmuramoyl-L-alanine amidase family protein [Candidatus Caldatribacteriota bacterium]
MKKIFYLIFAVIALTIFFSPCFNLVQASGIEILVDDELLETAVPSFIENDRIFISARNIIEVLGGRITWFPALKLLTIKIDSHVIRLVIDDPSLEMDKKVISLEAPAKIIGNRVMIPLEVLKIIVPVEIKWDNKSKVLSINSIKPYLLKIRSYTHPDKTRIVIDMSEKTEFKADKLVNPDRIYVDIMGSILKLGDSFKKIDINDGTLKTVRAAKFNKDITRVVFDLYQENRYDIFDLAEPDRIVVDIFKLEKKKDSTNEVLPTQSTQKPSIDSGVTGKRIVIIDPGHGGSDPGAIGPSGLKESEVALKIALDLEKLLKNAGIPTYLTRYKDEFISLEDRISFANRKNGFIFISLHANSATRNSSTAIGTETFVLSSKYIGASARDVADRENRASRTHPNVDTDLALIIADLEESANIQYSLDFAEIVQKKLVDHLKLKNRGVKQAPFVVLKGANMAAVLIEIAFLSNTKEEKLLKNGEFRQKSAQAIYEAIRYYLKNTLEEG